ncbi:unnamed protein product [Rotaria sp. Silwood1]|nr:unnamed protein product [Rotaria sp. Silwood1]
MSNFQIRSIILFVCYCFINVHGGAIQLTTTNIDTILSSYDIVFINFYANWCRFSQMLDPIYNELADKIAKEYPQQNLIAIGKVDCDSDNAIATKYHVNKYPTLKLFRHGIMTKREYRGARQVDAFFDFIRKQIESSITKISTPSDLITLDLKKHAFKSERPLTDVIYYRPPSTLNEKESYYIGLINEIESLTTWSRDKCVPLVREITFANAEELTDEGLPFLILFHKADDQESVALFEREVAKQLLNERSNINCLHADGAQFIHPLQHLGKSLSDLPLLAIDSFKHMFLFPDIKLISVDGKLLEFIKDLHSGKLHKDFHNPPPPTQQTSTTTIVAVVDDGDSKTKHIPKTPSNDNIDSASSSMNNVDKSGSHQSSPPESVFIRLTPNRQRYSFRDEL